MIKKVSFWLVLVFTLGIIILSCSTSRFVRQEDNIIIARVNGQEIFLENFQQKIEQLGYYSTSPQEDLQKKREALDALIIGVIVKQKARALDLSEDSVFQQSKAEHMKKFLLNLLYQNEITQEVVVTDQEIELYYQEHPYEFYRVPDKAKVSRILIKIQARPSSSDYLQEEEKALNKISMIRQRIINGEDFAQLAKELSGDKRSARKSGDIGLVSRRMIIPEFEDFIFSANLNELSQPIRSPQGWNLLKVRERIKGEKRGLDEEARMRTREFLKEQKQYLKSMEYVMQLKERTSFVFNNYALSSPDSLISDNPWVLIINQQDTIWYHHYRYFWDQYKSYLEDDTLTLEHKKDLLTNSPGVINPLLRGEAKGKGYLNLPQYLEEERNYTLMWAENKLKADVEDEMKSCKSTEEEIYDYYLAHRENYPTDSSIHVYHILFQDSLLAESVREEILNGADFVEMAEKYHSRMGSEGDISYDLGFISDQMMPEEFYKAAVLLQVGEISRPVKTEQGYHIIKLVERERSLLELYKPGIRIKLTKLKAQQIKQRWEEKLRQESDIWVDENLLKEIKLRKK